MLDQYWDTDLGFKVSCTTYLQGYVLGQMDSPLVIAMDEVNRLFKYPQVAQEFLPLLRTLSSLFSRSSLVVEEQIGCVAKIGAEKQKVLI